MTEAQTPALEPCQKCNDARAYAYDENHGKPCEACCPHDQGWWLLREHYGEDNGKYCCKRGCGETRWPEELGLFAPEFVENTRPSPASEPVAWMYQVRQVTNFSVQRARDTFPSEQGYTETPLYAHPPADRALLDEVREALDAVKAAMLRGGDGQIGDYGWSITRLNKARPLIHAALAKLEAKP